LTGQKFISYHFKANQYGAVAQLAERVARIHEARGSNPLSSTTKEKEQGPLNKRPLFFLVGFAATRVDSPYFPPREFQQEEPLFVLLLRETRLPLNAPRIREFSKLNQDPSSSTLF
jgi:hypothetical protein